AGRRATAFALLPQRVPDAAGARRRPRNRSPGRRGGAGAAARPGATVRRAGPARGPAIDGGRRRMGKFPYEDRFPINRTLPDHGRPRDEVLAELRAMASEEDAFWETGRCSGT